MKPVKAWAVMEDKGTIEASRPNDYLRIYRTKSDAMPHAFSWQRVVPVIIRPAPARGKKGKRK